MYRKGAAVGGHYVPLVRGNDNTYSVIENDQLPREPGTIKGLCLEKDMPESPNCDPLDVGSLDPTQTGITAIIYENLTPSDIRPLGRGRPNGRTVEIGGGWILKTGFKTPILMPPTQTLFAPYLSCRSTTLTRTAT